MSFVFYKFKPVNIWLIESIVSNTIYAASPKELNDPFDCQMDLKHEIDKAVAAGLPTENELLLSTYMNDDFFLKWNEILKKCGVLSFGLSNKDPRDNVLMWTHYAKEHTGICLEYCIDDEFIKSEWMRQNDLGKNSLIICRDVKYKPVLSLESLMKKESNIESFMRNLVVDYLTTKSMPWNYENEGRAIFYASGLVTLPTNSLASITFGLRTPESHQSLLMNILSKYSPQTKIMKSVTIKNKIETIIT